MLRVVLFGLFLFAGVCRLATADAPPKAYMIQTVAGSDFAGDGGPATQASLGQAEGIAISRDGAIYVADAADNRVRKITLDGNIQTVAGTGTAGFFGDGGAATAAQLNQPYGVAIDSAGNLFVADLGNARVRRISTGGIIQTVAGGGAIAPGDNGDGSPALMMRFVEPRNVAVDPDGTLFISDFGAHRVYRVSPGGILTTVAGTGAPGSAGDGASSQLARLNAPAGLVSDGRGTIYIADSGNNRIRRVSGGVISTVFNVTAPTGLALSNTGALYVAAGGYLGSTTKPIAGIQSAFDVALDSSGNVYATTGQFVRKVTSDGRLIVIAGSGGPVYFAGDNGPAASARLDSPSGVAVDSSGNCYIADTGNNRIRKVSASGMIVTIAGTRSAGSKGDNDLAAVAELSAPRGLAIDALNNIYIADAGNNKVREITPAGLILPIASGLNDPEAVAVGSDGSVYIADTKNNRVLKLPVSGAAMTVAEVPSPSSIAADGQGNLFVSGPSRVLKISASGDQTILLDGLNSPAYLTLDRNGDLLIAEPRANVIRRLTNAGSITTIAGTGLAGYSGDGGAAAEGQFDSPAALTVDMAGNIWVADQGNNRIRMLTPSTRIAEINVPVSVMNAASLLPGPIAPGEIVSIFGSGFDPNATQVRFDGKPAEVFYTALGQINALTPFDLAANSNSTLSITVNGSKISEISVSVAAAALGIFTTATGKGPAAANNQDGSINSATNPAARGSIVCLYVTGAGATPKDVGATIGGSTADVLYAGPTPGFTGLTQINLRLPVGIPAPGAQPVVLKIGSVFSQPGVTVAVQ